ncbi:2-oxo acid dehydrogenase subunit E2 [Pedococcus sp. KACC 23699]|uniref:Dihydrolipoamide acetyltransferase component of pyruvate dehydrogenase complex n=1 Tax=Pedococcus sp. KACC 23699 TaxID=3149228 RepID=A0AAU7JSF3_9MICO
MGEFRMPSLGADMEEGILLEWLTEPGATVHRGDVVAVVETPKSAVEVETFEDGVVGDLLVGEGETVPVGTVLTTLGAAEAKAPEHRPRSVAGTPAGAGATAQQPAAGHPAAERGLTPPQRHRARQQANAPSPERPAERPRERPAERPRERPAERPAQRPQEQAARATRPAPSAADHGVASTGARTRPPGRHRVSPLARRLAEEAGVDLSRVVGTGAAGAVRAVDVRGAVIPAGAATAAPPATPATPGPPAARQNGSTPGATTPPGPPTHADGSATDMRRSIAALMSRSNREIPHYHLTLTIDVQAAVDFVHARNRELPMGEQLVTAALLLVAAARAAKEVPQLNGHWVDDGFRPASRVDLGLILSLRGGGLLVPAIADADLLGAEAMMSRIRELTKRARAGRLRGSDLSTPSISVSNLGDQGADSVLGVIYPPQVALVGFGAVGQRPWAVGGMLGVRSLVTATLSGDHRATDGATGARLLRAIDRLLQRPEEL